MPKESDSISTSGEAGGRSPPFSDVLFQNERAMWWAEFDSVGEEAVRGYVERNSYTPTGMEAARQWLARREFLQLREDVQSIKALAEHLQEAASQSLRSVSDASTLASRVDANSRAIADIADHAKKTARIMVLIGAAACLLALCAIVMALVSSRQVAPNTKRASAPPPKQAALRPLPPAVPLVEMGQASATPPENPRKEQPSDTPEIKSPDLKPEGRSLAEVLALIADKVSGEGTINFTAQFHDMASGSDHTEQLLYRINNVTIDPNRCQIGYHWHVEQYGGAVSDQDHTVELRLAKSVTVTSIDAESGRRFSVRTYPKVYVVHIARRDNASGDDLYFHDKATAARVGAAARHAVELCDNGEQQFRRR